jgi:hypothetical protein
MRLGNIWPAAVAAGVVLSACAPSQDGPLAPDLSVISVTIAPNADTVCVGDSVQLSAIVVASGNRTRTANWSSSAAGTASVTSRGMVRGVRAGSAVIIASSAGKSDSALVTVLDTATVVDTTTPPPPPPPGGGSWPNEPAGWTTANDYDLSGLNTGGWASVTESNQGSISIASDPTAPASPSSVWQFDYPVGYSAAGVAPATEWSTMAPTQALFVGFWWKPSNPWQGHDSGVNKLMFFFTGDPVGLSQNLTIQMYGSGSGPFSTRMVGEGFEDVPYWENVGSTSPLALGVWHRIEILMNSPAGSLKWWVDGKLVGSYTGVPYPSYGFFQTEFSPTWGGVGGANKTEHDDFWFDQVHLSHP